MSRSYIPKGLRELVVRQSHYRCGYCLSSADKAPGGMSIEHIIPEALGGLTEATNLWLACYFCNSFKGDLVSAPDPFSGEVVSLFNPRHQIWQAHFGWSEAGDLIYGRTPTGRATVETLRINRPALVKARRKWLSGGWRPPQE